MAELFRSVKYFFIYPDPYQTQFLGSKHVWCFEITVFVRRETLGSKPPASDVGEKNHLGVSEIRYTFKITEF